LDHSVQFLKYEVPGSVPIKECHYTFAICELCHRLVNARTFDRNGVVKSCTQQVNDIGPSFDKYYPIRIKNPGSTCQLGLSKTCELARFACVVDIFEHLFPFAYCLCRPVLYD